MGRDSDVDEMSMILNGLASFLSAAVGALGLGGGGVLVLYLTMKLNLEQTASQGINLLFFIPCAVISVIINSKNKRIEWKTLLPIILGGVIGALAGVILTGFFKPSILKKIFAVFLLIIGCKELFGKTKKSELQKK